MEPILLPSNPVTVSRQEQGAHFEWHFWRTSCFFCQQTARRTIVCSEREVDSWTAQSDASIHHVICHSGRQLAALSQCQWRDDTRVRLQYHRVPLHWIIFALKRRVWRELVTSSSSAQEAGRYKIAQRRSWFTLNSLESHLNTKINCS